MNTETLDWGQDPQERWQGDGVEKDEYMQELNHHPKGEIETEASYLNATSESCQLDGVGWSYGQMMKERGYSGQDWDACVACIMKQWTSKSHLKIK